MVRIDTNALLFCAIIAIAGATNFVAPAHLRAEDRLQETISIFVQADVPSFRVEESENAPVRHDAVQGLSVSVDDCGRHRVLYDGRDIFHTAPGDIFSPVFISPDKNALYALSDRNNTRTILLAIPLDGEAPPAAIPDSFATDVAGAVGYGSDKPALAAIYSIDNSIQYEFFNSALRDMHARATRMFPDADILWMEGDSSGRDWVCQVLREDRPVEWYLFRNNTEEPEVLHKSDIPPLVLQKHPVRYPTRDGKTAGGYVTLPPGASSSPPPLVVFIHGGPSLRAYRWFDPRVYSFVKRGYAVFQPNYRGSRGFGKDWLRGGWREWGTGAAQHDITDGVAYLVEAGMADAERIAVFGGSFGGYAALSALLFTPEVYRCGASFFGPSDLLSYIRDNADSPLAGLDIPMFGDPGSPDDAARLQKQSPLYADAGTSKPLFLYHGATDDVTPVKHSDALAARLRQKGWDVEYLRDPDACHGFRDTVHEATVFSRMLDFLGKKINTSN